ncbi:MAG TPA: pyruvate dehydrogenase (acetyl-transferring) E1 component subunit alpha [Chloroflexota bacterium]
MNRDELVGMYREMLLIRRFEEKAAEMYAMGKVGGFLHLYIGEEAVAVGVVSAMNKDDDLVTHYRDHGYALAKGLDPKRIMAELLGKETGVSGGRGGSMHLADVGKHYWGGYAIVGGHLPLATGIALANQYQENGRATVCVLGDGATNIGEWHESLNLAALWRLPIVFVVENNSYGMGTQVSRASSVLFMHAKGCAYGMPGRQVDGMDLLQVRDAVSKAVAVARDGLGPSIIEAMTYRYRGHSMADPELYRRKEEVETWKLRDPVRHFETSLELGGLLAKDQAESIEGEVERVVDDAVQFAEQSPDPTMETIFDHLYASGEPAKGAEKAGEAVAAGR